MNIDYEVVSFIGDQLLTNPNVVAEDIYTITNLASEDLSLYMSMIKWMEEVDEVKREGVYKDMLSRKNVLLGKNVLPFPKRFA